VVVEAWLGAGHFGVHLVVCSIGISGLSIANWPEGMEE